MKLDPLLVRSYAVLAVVVLTQLTLCGDFHARRWHLIIENGLFRSKTGEGLFIRGNGLGYYAWLRSPLIDHDWDFDNEFDEHDLPDAYTPPRSYRTGQGKRANQWSVGPACVWAATIAPAHLIVRAANGIGCRWESDGYSLPYQLTVGATSVAVACVGLGFIYRLCRTQARPTRAALASSLIALGTTIVYYNSVELSVPHGLGTAVLAATVWYWFSTYSSVRPQRWLLVGMLTGAAALMRWQLATFAVLLVAEWLLTSSRHRRFAIPHATLAAAGAIIMFTPQLIAWRCVYGSWLVNPIQGVRHHWSNPSFWEILCSEDRSLFYWTPVALLGFLGTIACLRPTKAPVEPNSNIAAKEPLWILFAAFVIQVYALAGMWGKGEVLEKTGNSAGVFLASSYGFRDLTESLVVLAPGLAWLMEHARPWLFRLLTALGLLLVTWNLLVVSLYTNELIPSQEGASLATLLTQASAQIREEPFVLLQAAQSSILIALILCIAKPRQSETRGLAGN